MGRYAVWMVLASVVLACGDDDGPAREGVGVPAPEVVESPEPEREPSPEPPADEGVDAEMVVLVEERALERRSLASPSAGEPWAAERVPVEGSFVLMGATGEHVLLHELVPGGELGLRSRFHVVPAGGAAAAPVDAERAHLAPDGEHWLVERSYQRSHCGGLSRGRNLFVRTFGSDEERALGEGFVGFGPGSTVALSMTTSECGGGGGLRNHRSFVRMVPFVEPEQPPAGPGGIGAAGAGDDPNAQLAFLPAPWIDGDPVTVDLQAEVFGPRCSLTLGGERTVLVGPACRQPESAGFSADGRHYAFVMHAQGQAALWVVERASGEVRKVPLGPAGDAGAMPGICGGPTGERWLVTRPDAKVVAVIGTEIQELGPGLCVGAAPGGRTWAVQLGDRIELREASDPTAPGTVLEGVTGLRWLPPAD